MRRTLDWGLVVVAVVVTMSLSVASVLGGRYNSLQLDELAEQNRLRVVALQGDVARLRVEVRQLRMAAGLPPLDDERKP